eukprot:UN10149
MDNYPHLTNISHPQSMKTNPVTSLFVEVPLFSKRLVVSNSKLTLKLSNLQCHLCPNT